MIPEQLMKERTGKTAFTDSVVMVRPDYFKFNPQTKESNGFQKMLDAPEEVKRQNALREFGGMVTALQQQGVDVITLASPSGEPTPDAVFPNNWFYTDDVGRLVIFPMHADNRRKERQVVTLESTLDQRGFGINMVVDLTHYEEQGKALEGTGSMVLDRTHGIAYAIDSPRTDEEVFRDFCAQCGYDPVFFHAQDREGKPIYHTNVIMTVGDGFTVLCDESIGDPKERTQVLKTLERTNPIILPISFEQVKKYCGNLLALRNKDGTNKIVMSQTALEAFTTQQLAMLKEHGDFIPFKMETIETEGGGSARCTIAENFLPKKN